MKTSKNTSFSALSQSLAVLGEDFRSGESPVTKSKKKNHKKKSNKPKATTEPDGTQISAISETHVEDVGEWIPVISKKLKLKENGLPDGATSFASDNGSQKQDSLPEASKTPAPFPSAIKKKKRNAAKKNEQSPKAEMNVNIELKEEAVTSSKVNPLQQSQPVQQQALKTKASAPVETLDDSSLPLAAAPPSSTHQHVPKKTECPSNLSGVISSYARQLEFMLAEKIGSECIAKARSSYPSLKFSLPPPSFSDAITESFASSKSDAVSKMEVAFLRADLLAKESEVKVLMETLKRLQEQSSLPPTPPLIVLEEKKPEPEKPLKKPKTATKHVQCDISVVPAAQPVVNQQQQEQNSTPPQPPPASPAPSANELTFLKSLQDEIANLSRENAILTQRCNNANSRLEVANQKYSKLQSETKKTTSKAVKEAEARVRQETEALVKKLQDEVAEKAAQFVTKSSEIESLEKELADSQSKVNQLTNSEQTSKARVTECEKTISDLKVKNDKITKEKEALVKKVEEVDVLNHDLAEKEAEMAKIQEECDRLKNDLERSNSELAASKQAIADLTTDESALKAAEAEKNKALVEVARLKEECSHLKDDLEKTHSELVASKQAVADSLANESALKSAETGKIEALAEVEHLKEECSRLKIDLEQSQSELAASKQAVANLTTSESALKAAEEEKDKALDEIKLLKEEHSRLKGDLKRAHSELAASKQTIADMKNSESDLKTAEAKKDEALAEVERLTEELSTVRGELSAKQSELDHFKRAQATMESESASTEAGTAISESAESACSHCVELTEELSCLRSTLSKADQDLRKLQKSLDCEETSRVENGDINGCLENGDCDQEANH
ncbi:hypothetical protein Aperf_G00000059295 [Anoplocephala perfoliata]